MPNLTFRIEISQPTDSTESARTRQVINCLEIEVSQLLAWRFLELQEVQRDRRLAAAMHRLAGEVTDVSGGPKAWQRTVDHPCQSPVTHLPHRWGPEDYLPPVFQCPGVA